MTVTMHRFIEDPQGEELDLLIIGGGITGAAIAYDAALRGISVAVVEKRDFGCATSSVTSKLIHGGFRYLKNMELGLVRESLRERRTLENIAPNFVYPIPVILCAYDSSLTTTMPALRTGMTLYEWLSYDKGDTWDKAKAIPGHRVLTADEALALEPTINRQGLKGAGMQYDCANTDPERLTLAFIRSAVANGAKVANYAKVEQFLDERGRIRGAVVRDLLNDRTHEVRARLTVNCSGPWADLVLGLVSGGASDKKLRRSEGVHAITRRLVSKHLVGFAGKRGGHFFLIPWRDHTIIGTTDKEYIGNPDEYRVTRESVQELLDEVNEVLGREEVTWDDVIHVYGGLRPLVEDQTKSVYESSRKYEIHDNGEDGLNGLLTVEGGKYTTSRNLAQNALKKIEVKLGRPSAVCQTAKRRLVGSEIDDVDAFVQKAKAEHPDFSPKTVEWIARHYGTELEAVLAIARENPAWKEPLDADGEIGAQVIYAIRHEMALTLDDLVLRRTGIGTLGNPGDQTLETVATLAAKELGWNEERKARELASIRAALTLPAQ